MDNTKIDEVVKILEPYPWFREDRRKRLNKPMDEQALRDFEKLARAIKKAERIITALST